MNEFQKQIHRQLISALKPLDKLRHCAFLDYPNHLNIGDHLIGLGSLLYLTDVNQTEVNYIASDKDFNEDSFLTTSQNSPIVFHGGGNLGDLWPKHQNFREHLIGKYKDREIYILPQTIYFREPQNLEKAKQVFNSHPNLTLFCRDRVSYEIAKKHFYDCQIKLAPDMAFQLLEPRYKLEDLQVGSKTGESLYLKRKDKENSDKFHIDASSYIDCVEDWISFNEIDNRAAQISRLQRDIFPDVIRGKFYHKTKAMALEKQNLTLNLLYMGVQQLSKYSLIVTDRLHGHILSILLGIPNIFMPNSYHKNQAFYETWTEGNPNSVFLKSVEEFQQLMQSQDEKIGVADDHLLSIILHNIRYRNYRKISMAATQGQSGKSRLEEIQADLERSHSRLSQIKAFLE
jgi:exopolysaccharide biosynthesis predicted pyruvyltransferase EpsI